MIAPEYFLKDSENIKYQLANANGIIKKNKINIDTLIIKLYDTLDFLSRKHTETIIYNSFDSTTGLKKATLLIYFGPYKLFPNKNQITGIELNMNFDLIYRQNLNNNHKLRYFYNADSIKHKQMDDFFNNIDSLIH